MAIAGVKCPKCKTIKVPAFDTHLECFFCRSKEKMCIPGAAPPDDPCDSCKNWPDDKWSRLYTDLRAKVYHSISIVTRDDDFYTNYERVLTVKDAIRDKLKLSAKEVSQAETKLRQELAARRHAVLHPPPPAPAPITLADLDTKCEQVLNNQAVLLAMFQTFKASQQELVKDLAKLQRNQRKLADELNVDMDLEEIKEH